MILNQILLTWIVNIYEFTALNESNIEIVTDKGGLLSGIKDYSNSLQIKLITLTLLLNIN